MSASIKDGEKRETDQEMPEDEVLLYGWKAVTPRCLQALNNDIWFMVFFLMFHAFQSKKNFQITSFIIP